MASSCERGEVIGGQVLGRSAVGAPGLCRDRPTRACGCLGRARRCAPLCAARRVQRAPAVLTYSLDDLYEKLPRLRESPHRITSGPDDEYNCVAWSSASSTVTTHPGCSGQSTSSLSLRLVRTTSMHFSRFSSRGDMSAASRATTSPGFSKSRSTQGSEVPPCREAATDERLVKQGG
jgi:hypothetical protein